MDGLDEVLRKCKELVAQSGVDGRTCYFAGILKGKGVDIHALQEATGLKPRRIKQLLEGYTSDRYVDFAERRALGLNREYRQINLVLSQGYKRSLVWRGVPLGKTSWDVCIYSQLLQELRPNTIIEFGTGMGASALFFRDHCRMLGLDTKIITLDLNPNDVSPVMSRDGDIKFIAGDVKDLGELLPLERIRGLPHPWLVVEDCHRHIPTIVLHLQPLMATGDYLVIEDISLSARGSQEIKSALKELPKGALMVDTFYTDMFGRNVTCSPDSIFRKM